jgi:hypothetical protein
MKRIVVGLLLLAWAIFVFSMGVADRAAGRISEPFPILFSILYFGPIIGVGLLLIYSGRRYLAFRRSVLSAAAGVLNESGALRLADVARRVTGSPAKVENFLKRKVEPRFIALQTPSKASGRGLVELRLGFFRLAFFLFFCEPRVVLDGTTHLLNWGTYFFELEPGRHQIAVSFHYLFWRECGRNSTAFEVKDGQFGSVTYFL